MNKTDNKKSSPIEMDISKKIRELIKQAGTNPNAVARGVGIDNANFYRLLDNKRHWKLDNLEKVCEFLGTTIANVVCSPLEIPIVASISALEPFPYPNGVIENPIGTVEYKGKVKADMQLKGLYALKVADRTMMPAFKKGTTLVVEKNSDKDIEEEDLVVCLDDQGTAQLCRVSISPDRIAMKPMNGAVPDKTLPRNYLKLCDRVILIYPTT